jgi:hypothetical protein
MPPDTLTHNPNVLFLPPVTEEEVLQIAKKLIMKSSTGFDEIPDMIVKQCIHTVVQEVFAHRYLPPTSHCKKAFDFYNKFIIKLRYLSKLNEN